MAAIAGIVAGLCNVPAAAGAAAPTSGTAITYLKPGADPYSVVGTSGAAAEWFLGGTGWQGLTGGGGGTAYFVFSPGDGPDWIVDFRPGTDKLVLVNPGAVAKADHTEQPSGVTGTQVTYGPAEADRVFLENVSAANLDLARDVVKVTRVPVYVEEVTQAGSYTPPPATVEKSIRLDPANPGELASAPATWNTVAVVSGLPTIKWAVFHKDTAGAYTSADTWHEVAVPSDGRAAISVAFKAARELLVVKSLDDAVVAESGLVSFAAATVPQPAPSNDHDFAAAWLADKTMGANIERNDLLYNGRITDAFLRDMVAKKLTHLRFFAGSGGNFGALIGQNDFRNWHLEGVRRALGAGVPGVHLDVLDVVYPWHMDEAHYSYVEECAKSIASYNFDPSRVIVGVANEWGNAKNADFQGIRERAVGLLRKHLPSFILVDSAGNWGDPWELCYGDFKPLPDRRMIHQWHLYHWEADQLSAAQNLQKDLEQWSAATGRLTYGGEWGIGPPSGDRAQEYDVFPATMDAAFRGMGQQRVAMWVITNGSYWRLNKEWNDPYLRDEIAAKFAEADAHIRAQAYFGAASTAPPAPAGTIDSLAPQNPGTLTETAAGAGVKVRTVVKTTNVSRIKHVVARADHTWRQDYEVDTTGEVAIEPVYFDTGDFLKVMDAANLNTGRDGGAATVNKAAGSAAPAPSGGAATRIDLLVRGQSNAYLADDFGSVRKLAATLEALTGVPVNLISRKGQGSGDNTLHSSTSHAWVDPWDNSFGYWLSPPGANYSGDANRSAINYSTDPATWAASGPMTETLAAVSRFRSTDANSVFVDCRLPHWEYDLVMYGDAQPYYRGMAWEVTKRIQQAAGKASGRHFVLYGHCPYLGKTLRAVDAIDAAWASDEAERGVIVAGNMMDASPYNGTDYSHWNPDGPDRSFPRVAFAIAHKLWNAGLLPSSAIDLSDAPSRGPRIGTPTLANSTTVTVPIEHDRGGAIQAMNNRGEINWGDFHCSWDGGGADATGGSITAPNQLSLNFPGGIGANRRLHYCRWPGFMGDTLLVDNWHQNRPSKYGSVPNIGSVVFPLRRTLRGVPF